MNRQTAEAARAKTEVQEAEKRFRGLRDAHAEELAQQKQESEKYRAEAKASEEKLKAAIAENLLHNQSPKIVEHKTEIPTSRIPLTPGDRGPFILFQKEINDTGQWMKGAAATGAQGYSARVLRLKAIPTDRLSPELAARWAEWLAALSELAEAPAKSELQPIKAQAERAWRDLRDQATVFGLDVGPVRSSGE